MSDIEDGHCFPHNDKAFTSNTPRTDALRHGHPLQVKSSWAGEILDSHESLERELNQERIKHFQNVETERRLKSEKREQIQALERDLAAAQALLKQCGEALDDLKQSCISIIFPLLNKKGDSSIAMWLPEQMQVSKAMQDTDTALSHPLMKQIMEKPTRS